MSLLGLFLLLLQPGQRDAAAQTSGYFRTEGSQIVDSRGNPVLLTGINWFGLETSSYAPHGLWARNWESLLDQILELGFNTIRLPYSNQLFDPGSLPNGINYDLNPELQDLSGLEIMDKIIGGAGARGLRVILDRHRPDSNAQSDLWYTARYDEERWIRDWVMLAERYTDEATVIGMDLHNEPHGRATWGSGDPATDWRLAAERAGNAILAVNPNLLIIVQGVDQYQGDWYWWGGNLKGVREYPVRLSLPGQLVYSTHVYGPGVYPQPWFWEPGFPDNLPGIWERKWGFIAQEQIAPLIVGEFGGRSVGDDKEGIWQRTLISYLRNHNLSYFYWTLNPNSGDTGGLLLDDWQSVDPDKYALLSGYQFSILGIEERAPEPAADLPLPEPLVIEGLRLRYRTATPLTKSSDSKPEFIIYNDGPGPVPLSRLELVYYLDGVPPERYVFHCDWAAIGCGNLSGEFFRPGPELTGLRLRFGPGSPLLLPGQESGEIKIRIHRSDWIPLDQNEQLSFGPVGEFIDWQKAALEADGRVLWGPAPPVDRSLDAPAREASLDRAVATPVPLQANEPALSPDVLAENDLGRSADKARSATLGFQDSERSSDWNLAQVGLIVLAGVLLLAAGLRLRWPGRAGLNRRRN